MSGQEYPPLKIGTLSIDPPVALAPMAGYTDSAFRAICCSMGAGIAYTEVVNAEGIVRGSNKTLHMLEVAPEEKKKHVGAHIYGANPQSMAEAAGIIEDMQRFDLIDVNCGCPVRKIVAKGAGAALIKDPAKIHKIVKAITAGVSCPVTVKTRIGFYEGDANISEIAHAVEDAGGSAIAIHGRFASKKHSGSADWETLARIKQERAIPVIGNGGINCARDALEMLRQTRVDGVMIGRAAVGNPWIFSEIIHLLNGAAFEPPSLEEVRSMIYKHLAAAIALMQKERRHKYKRSARNTAEESAVLHFRGHLYRYLSGYDGWGAIRRKMNEIRSGQQVTEAVDGICAGQELNLSNNPSNL